MYKLGPLGVQQLDTGTFPELYTFLSPRFIVILLKVPITTTFTYYYLLPITNMHLRGVDKVKTCPFKGTAPLTRCCTSKCTVISIVHLFLQL